MAKKAKGCKAVGRKGHKRCKCNGTFAKATKCGLKKKSSRKRRSSKRRGKR